MANEKVTEVEAIANALYNILRTGHQNALTRSELCRRLKCSDRMLRRGIEHLRLEHAVLTNDDGKGYYLPEATDEGRDDTIRWIKKQQSRINAIRTSQSGAVKFAQCQEELEKAYIQLSLFGGT